MKVITLVSLLVLVSSLRVYGQYPYILCGHVLNADGSVPADGDIRVITSNKTRKFAIDTAYNGGTEHTFWAANISYMHTYGFNWGDTVLVVMENVNRSSAHFGESDTNVYVPTQDKKLAVVEIGKTVVAVESGELPREFHLSQNYPNPFNPSTKFDYQVPRPSVVRFEIYSILGQRVVAADREHLNPGYYHFVWDGRGSAGQPVATGIYFFVMSADDFRDVKKILLLK